jgi:hypothetical protein
VKYRFGTLSHLQDRCHVTTVGLPGAGIGAAVAKPTWRTSIAPDVAHLDRYAQSVRTAANPRSWSSETPCSSPESDH